MNEPSTVRTDANKPTKLRRVGLIFDLPKRGMLRGATFRTVEATGTAGLAASGRACINESLKCRPLYYCRLAVIDCLKAIFQPVAQGVPV
jgi:hypothetical protein